MERGSVIDAQIELQSQVAKLYQQRICRYVHIPMFEDRREKSFYDLWMTPDTYGVSVIKPRGPALFIPSFESLVNMVPFDDYGQIIKTINKKP